MDSEGYWVHEEVYGNFDFSTVMLMVKGRAGFTGGDGNWRAQNNYCSTMDLFMTPNQTIIVMGVIIVAAYLSV